MCWSTSRKLLAIVFLFTTVAVGRSQEVHKEGRDYVGEWVKTFNVTPGGTLRMIDIRGDVEATGVDTKQVTVREKVRLDVYTESEARTAMQRIQTSYSLENNVVTVRGSRESRDWIQSSFTVEVPRKFNIEIETSGGDLDVSEISGSVELSSSGGDITVDEIDGNVDARTSGGDIEGRGVKGDLDIETSGGDIDLENLEGLVDARTSGGDVTLRGSKKEVILKTSGGDIEVQDAGPVTASTSGGDVELRHVRGRVDARTSGGDMDLSDCDGPVSAVTAGGEIRGENIGVGIEAKTAGGEIDLVGISGYIEARTAGGNIEAEMTLTDFTKDHHVDMETAGGDLILALPAKIPATVEAEIRMERWGDYSIRSDFPLKITEEEAEGKRTRRWRVLRATGDLNGGGALIQLSTTNGDIVIEKR